MCALKSYDKIFALSSDLDESDLVLVSSVYEELQEHTHGLCRGGNSLPVLAVELQNSCHLLQVCPYHDTLPVTIISNDTVPVKIPNNDTVSV